MTLNSFFKRVFFRVLPVAALFMFCTSCRSSEKMEKKETDYSKYYENLPFQMQTIVQPKFPDYSVNIIDFGAVSDGYTLNTKAINDAINHVSQKGGGKVIISQGLWLTGPIVLQSNVNLYTERNALVLFTDDFDQYPIIQTSFEGLSTRRCQSPISANEATNIAITGHGVFDGSGDSWRPVKKEKMTERQWKDLLQSGGFLNEKGNIWYPTERSLKGSQVTDDFNNPRNLKTDEEWESVKEWLRPVMVSLIKSRQILIQGVTLKNSPSWCLHPLSCEDITIDNIYISNPWYSQNGDALDLESCNRALIVNSTFDAGDDAICIKSGKDKEGRLRGEPCQNVIVKDCTVLHGHGGFVVGSEMSGGVKNIFVSNCTFLGTDVGLRFKSTRGRGGVVENIFIENINMINIPTEPLLFDLYYGGKSAIEQESSVQTEEVIPAVTEETPAFRNIQIKNVYCKGAKRAMLFNGLPEMNIENISIENVFIQSKFGAEISQSTGITLKNVTILPENGATVLFKNAKNVTIEGLNEGQSLPLSLSIEGKNSKDIVVKSKTITKEDIQIADSANAEAVRIEQ